MERIQPTGSPPKYQPEGVSGPEDVAYRNQLQVNLAELAFPEAASRNDRMLGWTDGGSESLAAKFDAWFSAPHPHIHLDEVDTLGELLRQLRGQTPH